MRSLLLILLLVTAVSAIENYKMRRYCPLFDGAADEIMISNRRKADKVVGANVDEAKEVAARKHTNKHWGVAKQEQGGELSVLGRGLFQS